MTGYDPASLPVSREWAAIAAQVSARWPHAAWSRETAAVMADDLADHDPRDVLAAVKAYARQPGSDHPPKLHQLLVLLRPPARDYADAWAEVQRQVFETGAYGRFASDDVALVATVRALGWRNLCMAPTGDTTLYAQFRDAYRSFQTRDRELVARGELGLPTGESPALRLLAGAVGEVMAGE